MRPWSIDGISGGLQDCALERVKRHIGRVACWRAVRRTYRPSFQQGMHPESAHGGGVVKVKLRLPRSALAKPVSLRMALDTDSSTSRKQPRLLCGSASNSLRSRPRKCA